MEMRMVQTVVGEAVVAAVEVAAEDVGVGVATSQLAHSLVAVEEVMHVMHCFERSRQRQMTRKGRLVGLMEQALRSDMLK
jgi:hypothetical protein